MDYGYIKKLSLGFDEVLEKTKKALAKEGFGILNEINVQKTLKNKMNINFNKYIILGACNPPFAYEALKIEKQIGLLLPCNVIIYEEEKKIIVSVVSPLISMGFIKNKKLINIIEKVDKKLKKVISNIN